MPKRAVFERSRRELSLDASVEQSSLESQSRLCAKTPLLMVCMYGHTYSKSMDQPGKVANPASGQLNREK